MIIGIDGNEANIKERVGVGRYAYELLNQLNRLRVNELTSCEVLVYLKDQPLPDLPKETAWWEYKIIGPKKFWTQFGLPLALFFQGPQPDVFFTPSHYAPRFCPSPRVISIMDLSYLYFPEMFKKNDLWQLRNWTAYSVKKAAKILTISQSTKSDIIKYYKVSEDKVVVTYPGGNKLKIKNSKFKITMKNSKLLKKYGIIGEYILSVGTIQPRKNYQRLIEAFALLASEVPHQLVIVGKPGWLYEEIYAAPKKFGVEKRVRFLNYVPDEDLPVLYQGASCFVLVSLYEGFGIPVLEAMSFGCPVVVSNISSLPEVAGEAGTLVDPYNIKDIARGIKEAMADKEKLIKKGFKQVGKFSWEKCAKETLKVLEEVGGMR